MKKRNIYISIETNCTWNIISLYTIQRFHFLLKYTSTTHSPHPPSQNLKSLLKIFRRTDRSHKSRFGEKRGPSPGCSLLAPLCCWHKVTVVPSLDAAQILQHSKRGLQPKNWASIHVSGTAVLLFCSLHGFSCAKPAESYRAESELHLASSVIVTEWVLSLRLHLKYCLFVFMKRSGER